MIHAVYPFTPEDLDRAILFDGIVGRQSSAVMSSSFITYRTLEIRNPTS